MLAGYRVSLVLAGLLAMLAWRSAGAEDKVPDWFRFDSARPFAIFDAWKELSTRKATICLGENWSVLAGRVENKRGEPVRNTPIELLERGAKSRAAIHLQTDEAGHFVIYSPLSLEIGPRDGSIPRPFEPGFFIVATPGFPATQAGKFYAYKRHGSRWCQPKLLLREQERAFYLLTCDDQSSFDADEFQTFEREYLARKPEPRRPYRAQPRDPEGKPESNARYLDVRVEDESGKAVSDAIVKYRLSGLAPGFQIRATDMDGRCRIEEWHRTHGDRILRGLTIDAPGFGVGPVPFDPNPDTINVVRLAPPAAVLGSVEDHEGNPLATGLGVRYRRFSWIDFETDFASHADGTFRFDRIMPNEEFAVVSGDRRSEWISLKPGESSKAVKLQLALAAAVRGVVVAEDGSLVARGLGLDYGPRMEIGHGLGNEIKYYVGTNNGPWGPNDGRFGFFGLDNRPFRIRVGGWEVDPSEPIQLEPGELRFVRVTLKKKAAK